MVNGYSAIALTKLDILDTMDEIKMGVGYMKNGQKLDYFPGSNQVGSFECLCNTWIGKSIKKINTLQVACKNQGFVFCGLEKLISSSSSIEIYKY